MDRAEGLLIAPVWPTQPWYSRLSYMLVEEPVLLPKSKNLLTNAVTGVCHPMPNLQLMCCRLSGKVLGNTALAEKYHRQRSTSSSIPGDLVLEHNMRAHSKNGQLFANGEAVIWFKRL